MPDRIPQFFGGFLFLLFSITLVGSYGWLPMLVVGMLVAVAEMICSYGQHEFCTVTTNFIAQTVIIWYGIALLRFSDLVPVIAATFLLFASYGRNYYYAFRRRSR